MRGGNDNMEVEDIETLYQELKSKTDVMIELKTAWYGMQEFYRLNIYAPKHISLLNIFWNKSIDIDVNLS